MPLELGLRNGSVTAGSLGNLGGFVLLLGGEVELLSGSEGGRVESRFALPFEFPLFLALAFAAFSSASFTSCSARCSFFCASFVF